MSVNGEMFGPGCGADILGHPLNALAWLANAVQAQGGALRAGEIILLGSVVQTKWLDPGDVVEVDIEGLGKVKATFA
jgi:2-keto-4-pentenoate hydratase